MCTQRSGRDRNGPIVAQTGFAMTTNDNDLPTDKIRCVARHLLETCDKCHSMTDGTLEYIECEDQYEQAKQRLLRLTVEYGLYLTVPIFQQVEHEYRQQNPATTIPSNAVGALVEVFVGDEYDAHFGLDLDLPLNYDRGWELAVALMSFPPDLAKCIQEFPLRMMSCVSPNVRWHGHEQVLDDLVTTICRSKGIDVADTDLPPLGDYRTGKLGDAVKALSPSLAECIQDLSECFKYRIQNAGPKVNGYLFERLLYDLIDALVDSSNETQMAVIQDETA